MPEFQEALESQSAKQHLPNTLRSADLERLPGALRSRARFSAGMIHTEYLSTVDSVLERTIKGELDTATALLEMDRSLGSLGFDSVTGRGHLKQHRSFARRKLVLDTNLSQAGNYGQWMQNNTETALSLYPCWEYYRAFQRQEPRDWRARWLAAGGTLYQGRMIATKDDPIWTNSILNRFGTPYPPFDFNSGMRLRPVRREDAEQMGVISANEDVLPAFQDFTAESMAAANASGALKSEIEKALADVAKFDDKGVLRMLQGPSWADYGLESAGTWRENGVAAPPLVSEEKARQLLTEGIPATDYDLRPIILDKKLIHHWEVEKVGNSPKQTAGRLQRLNYALDTLEAPREHWNDRGHDIYFQVFRITPTKTRGMVVVIDPQGYARTYWLEKGFSRMDGSRRGKLVYKPQEGQGQ